jgi:hypothetical protein
MEQNGTEGTEGNVLKEMFQLLQCIAGNVSKENVVKGKKECCCERGSTDKSTNI